MKRIYRHYKNHWKFELVAIVKADEVAAEIARRKQQDEMQRAAGWLSWEVEYRVS